MRTLQIRRLEKKLNEALTMSVEDRRNIEHLKEAVSFVNLGRKFNKFNLL